MRQCVKYSKTFQPQLFTSNFLMTVYKDSLRQKLQTIILSRLGY